MFTRLGAAHYLMPAMRGTGIVMRTSTSCPRRGTADREEKMRHSRPGRNRYDRTDVAVRSANTRLEPVWACRPGLSRRDRPSQPLGGSVTSNRSNHEIGRTSGHNGLLFGVEG